MTRFGGGGGLSLVSQQPSPGALAADHDRWESPSELLGSVWPRAFDQRRGGREGHRAGMFCVVSVSLVVSLRGGMFSVCFCFLGDTIYV